MRAWSASSVARFAASRRRHCTGGVRGRRRGLVAAARTARPGQPAPARALRPRRARARPPLRRTAPPTAAAERRPAGLSWPPNTVPSPAPSVSASGVRALGIAVGVDLGPQRTRSPPRPARTTASSPTSSPARPSVVRPMASGLEKASRDEPIAARTAAPAARSESMRRRPASAGSRAAGSGSGGRVARSRSRAGRRGARRRRAQVDSRSSIRRRSEGSSAPPTAAAISSGSWVAWVRRRTRHLVAKTGRQRRAVPARAVRGARRPPRSGGNRAVGQASRGPGRRGRGHGRSATQQGTARAVPDLCGGGLQLGPGQLAVGERDDDREIVRVVPVSHGTAPSGPRAGRAARAGRGGSATSRSRARRRSCRRSRRSRSPRRRTGRWRSAGRR